MKKIISIVLGVAALAACTKTSVSYEQPGEIALAPVTRANMTKAAITGTTFPTTNDMGVYAFYNTLDAGTLKANFLANSAAYLKNVKFVNRTGTGNWAVKQVIIGQRPVRLYSQPTRQAQLPLLMMSRRMSSLRQAMFRVKISLVLWTFSGVL